MSISKRIKELEDKTNYTPEVKNLNDWYRQFDDADFKKEFLLKWYGKTFE